jgi:Histidine phosphatase superfamily (branch 1)
VEASARSRGRRLGLTLLVIRHAWAGEASEWDGDDRLRPLDERGAQQAAALVDALASFEITRVLSSPNVRCVQTVEPLARVRGLPVEPRDELGEERQDREGVELARSLVGEPVAICVHGGLSDAAFGASQKKGETLVVDREGEIVQRIRV